MKTANLHSGKGHGHMLILSISILFRQATTLSWKTKLFGLFSFLLSTGNKKWGQESTISNQLRKGTQPPEIHLKMMTRKLARHTDPLKRDSTEVEHKS